MDELDDSHSDNDALDEVYKQSIKKQSQNIV